MQNIKFIQIYKDNQEIYQELLPKWIHYFKELNEHDPSLIRTEEEIIHDLTRRVKIQGDRSDMHFELLYCDDVLIGFSNFAIDLGTVYGLLEKGYGTVMEFYIVPEHRRKGYGRLFYEHIEKTLQNDGASKMYVCPDNVTGEPFRVAMGFADSGKIDPDNEMPIYIK